MDKKTGPVKVLVLTSCAGEKKFNPPNIALVKDLDNLVFRNKKEAELENYKAKAKEMFISSQNKMIMEGLGYVPASANAQIDIAYISSGYGFINSDDEIIPYNVNFSAMTMHELDDRAKMLKIHEETYYTAKNYDIILFLLGYEYLRTLRLPLPLSDTTRQIFFISPSDEKVLPPDNEIFVVLTGVEEAAKFEVTPAELKGYFFKQLCLLTKEDDSLFEKIYQNPKYIEEFIKKHAKNITTKANDQLKLFDFD
jgi:hypothetical protein